MVLSKYRTSLSDVNGNMPYCHCLIARPFLDFQYKRKDGRRYNLQTMTDNSTDITKDDMTSTLSGQEARIENVKVLVRCRPLNRREIENGYESIVDVNKDKGLIEVRNPEKPSDSPKSFTYDSVYDRFSKQREIYSESLQGLVQSAIEGYNATVFAYGQTSMGKTYTMEGVFDDPEHHGVIQHAFNHIFQHISESEKQKYLIRASYIDIYNEEISDCLSRNYHNKLQIKEHPETGVYIKDLTYYVTSSIKEIDNVLRLGNKNRIVGKTNMGQSTSRSTAIFTIYIECQDETQADGNRVKVGKLNLIDLYGSERLKKTAAEGTILRETKRIAMSMRSLCHVVMALTDENSHIIPYRDSKLTRLTQDALGGYGKTMFIACVGLASSCYDETISTLRFAVRVQHIKNKPKVTVKDKDSLLLEFQKEIERLKAEIEVIGIASKLEETKTGTDEISEESEENQLEQINNEEVKAEEEILKYEKELICGKIKAMEYRILTRKMADLLLQK